LGVLSAFIAIQKNKKMANNPNQNQNPNPSQNPNQMNIELPEELAEGTYANLAIISHSTSEFVVDFIRIMPNMPQAKVKSRIILTPEHAKRLLQALNDNVRRYEQQFGKIQDKDAPPMPMNFNTPKAQA
jgi:hypothetical protein